jgi:AcrR family transcriptional regulator
MESAPIARTQVDRSTATKRALVQAAHTVLLREGHTSATLVMVAREAGVTRGAIQHHFPGRVDLWLATLGETQTRRFRSSSGSAASRTVIGPRAPVTIIWSRLKFA